MTKQIARFLGERVLPGTVLSLIGDLGVGKTVFAQGLAEGLKIDDMVNSPTFTIVQIYEEGRIPFYHFDVYRIEEPDEMYEVGFEEYFYGEGVCLVEWADLIRELIPENHIRIEIRKNAEKGFDYREITISKQGR
ncbi:MAG: tRNA (adenosine(37)-N6)-threonylcarbamoyltransferase complex ATPase subunit type 1 TsaE [Lachnospiraceae bacterium]